jgi:hypothetical protein
VCLHDRPAIESPMPIPYAWLGSGEPMGSGEAVSIDRRIRTLS